eukprot:m.102595 g.102595  ORF g.102595 m.102595 type:complete len:63 (+) comp9079_c5_seq1:54-242(+)
MARRIGNWNSQNPSKGSRGSNFEIVWGPFFYFAQDWSIKVAIFVVFLQQQQNKIAINKKIKK